MFNIISILLVVIIGITILRMGLGIVGFAFRLTRGFFGTFHNIFRRMRYIFRKKIF